MPLCFRSVWQTLLHPSHKLDQTRITPCRSHTKSKFLFLQRCYMSNSSFICYWLGLEQMLKGSLRSTLLRPSSQSVPWLKHEHMVSEMSTRCIMQHHKVCSLHPEFWQPFHTDLQSHTQWAAATEQANTGSSNPQVHAVMKWAQGKQCYYTDCSSILPHFSFQLSSSEFDCT